MDAQLQLVRDAGYELTSCLLDPREPPGLMLSSALGSGSIDCVLIGAGLRSPSQSPRFEQVINVVHELAPNARVCFNTHPADSLDAVPRCIG